MMKRILALLLTLGLLLVGCGQTGGTSIAGDESKGEDVLNAAEETKKVAEDPDVPPYYDAEFLPADCALADGSSFYAYGDEILCMWAGNGDRSHLQGLYWTDFSGTARKELPLSLKEGEHIQCCTIGPDGTIYLIVSVRMDDYFVAEDHALDGFSGSHLMTLDREGNILTDAALPEGYGAYDALSVDGDGNIFVARSEFSEETGFFTLHYFEGLALDGTVSFSMDLTASVPGAELISVIQTMYAQDGTLLYVLQIDGDNSVHTFDLAAQTFSEPVFTPTGEMVWPDFLDGPGADFYLRDDNMGVMAWNLDGTSHSYFKYSDLPCTVPESARLVAVGEDNTWLFSVYVGEAIYFLQVFGQWEPVTETEKTTLTVGGYHSYTGRTDIETAVMAFNILHPDSELIYRDYSQDNTVSEEDAIAQLNEDILNGVGPDILILDNTFRCDVYAGNGYLTDLNVLMDGDETFVRENYLAEVWRTTTMDGKIYGLATSFQVTTFVGSERNFTEEGSWTPSECLTMAQRSDIPLMADAASVYLLKEYVLSYGLADYIDGMTCNFADGEFTAVLEIIAGDYPEDIYAEDFPIQNDLALTMACSIYGLRELLYLDEMYGEDHQFVGIPSPSGSVLSLSIHENLGIAETCRNKEAAWAFLRFILDDSGTVSKDWVSFPVNLETLEEVAEQAMLPSDDPDSLCAHSGSSVGEIELEGKPLTQESWNYFLDLVKMSSGQMIDPNVQTIVAEETAAFFQGDKTAEEVCDIIQNRVQIYLWEKS